MFNCCSSTYDKKALYCLLKEAQAAAVSACEAAKAAECAAEKACSFAKAAEEAACQAERSARAAQEARNCAEEIAEKIRCLLDEFGRDRGNSCRRSGCGCDDEYYHHDHSHDCC